MKRISKLKLNVIAESRLAEREMNALRGGGQPTDCCMCSCYWADHGGSSIKDNRHANYLYGYESTYGEPVDFECP